MRSGIVWTKGCNSASLCLSSWGPVAASTEQLLTNMLISVVVSIFFELNQHSVRKVLRQDGVSFPLGAIRSGLAAGKDDGGKGSRVVPRQRRCSRSDGCGARRRPVTQLPSDFWGLKKIPFCPLLPAYMIHLALWLASANLFLSSCSPISLV